MDFLHLNNKERRSRLTSAIQRNVLFHKNNNDKTRSRDRFSFLVNPTFKWQDNEVPESIVVEAKRKKHYVLIGLGVTTALIFGYFLLQTSTGEIDNNIVLAGTALLTFVVFTYILISYFVQTNDFELNSNGIIFGNKTLVPYKDLVLIHFRKVKSEPIQSEYIVFRFINRPKKEINLELLPYDKKELGQLIYTFLQLNSGLKEDDVLDR